MKKSVIIFFIMFLILFTALIKNSTKRIDEEIFASKENLRDLKKDFENIKLEYEYLSSAEKLLKFHDLYFDEKLIKKNIQEIGIIYQKTDKTKIKSLKLIGN